MSYIEPSTILACIENARRCEAVRDLEGEEKILRQFWTDFETEPEITDLPEETAAEILRLCGNFLVHYGRAKALSSFQERGKDMLSHAKDRFLTLGRCDSSALTKCQLAISYCYDGRAEEADAVLAEAEAEARRTELDDVLLRIKINRLITLCYLNRFDECAKIIKQVRPSIEHNADLFLRAMFYGQCGFIYDRTNEPEKAAASYRLAQSLAVEFQGKRVFALFTNGLAYVLKNCGRLDEAHAEIKKAIAVGLELGDLGWLINFYDTKAAIELAARRPNEALDTIERSLKILEKTDDVISHADSLWTKVTILLSLHRREEAALTFGELQAIAGRPTTEQYAAEFVRLMLEKNEPAEEREKEREKEYPKEEIVELTEDYFAQIQRLRLPNVDMDDLSFFFVPAELTKGLPVEGDAILVAEYCSQSERRNPVMLEYKTKSAFLLGQVRRERFDTGFGALTATMIYDIHGEPITDVTPDMVYYRGNVVAVAPVVDLDEGFLCFTRI